MIYFACGSIDTILSENDVIHGLFSALDKLGKKKKVLAIPPDFTRYHSKAGDITRYVYEYYRNNLTDILPALGTHAPMTDYEIETMFGNVPKNLFRVHRWREDLVTLGEVPYEFVYQVSEGKLNYSWPAQVNKLLVEGNFDLILSIGQVVPHEVIGMANYNKNIFVGTGGKEGINKSHFLGAVYGMERIMGRAENPVRQVLNYASENFANNLPIIYILTVIGKDENDNLVMRGLYIGDDFECFKLASELSLKVNFEMLDEPLKKIVVYLDPHEFKSTWLGNKSIYRTRMAIADNGELIVLAPGLKEFGEDKEIDRLIRKYGYKTTPEILKYVEENDDLKNNLSAAAHLIHGSSENRFTITYCPGHLSKEEIESVNFNYADLNTMIKKYNPEKLKDGFNEVDGEEIFFISNPALGLWAYKGKFN
ncbi:MAG: lactate racemase domain-containing protein [Melioribacter sp.]|uniref:lactate racemase domain-containing protein n=1 Tax=Rosettibacter primus TaxID=3111523 RepID=UPI00247E1BEB|nr:lactate racemase domain-containing protein [Melioribacter sp.]